MTRRAIWGGLVLMALAIAVMLTAVPAAATVDEGCLCIVKFNDLDRDGYWDRSCGEPEITGWPVRWIGPVSDYGCTRVCISVPVGCYEVRESSREGWEPTTPTRVLVNVCAGQTTVVKFGNAREEVKCCPRTMGYWKTHPEAITPAMYDVLKTLPAFSGVDTFGEVYRIFYYANAADMRCMLRAQLLAMTLNVLSGRVSECCCVKVYCIPCGPTLFGGSIVPIGDVLDCIEDNFPWSCWTRYEQEKVKNLLDWANNGWIFTCPVDGIG